jgi:hypothetical protein
MIVEITIALLLLLVVLKYKKSRYIYHNDIIYKLIGDSDKIPYVCLYAYHEKNIKYKNNLIYFLKNGILEEVEYYIIINGKCSVHIPNRKNITVLKRKNIGFYFGAWSYAIKKLKRQYEYYIFINSSVEGPHIPENSENNWLQLFLKLFNKDDIKLVGAVINMYDIKSLYHYNVLGPGPYSYVQSMFFILKNEAFNYLISLDFFNEELINSILSTFYILIKYEIRMSKLILNNGWNINCILPYYSGLDYRVLRHNINPSGFDPLVTESFFNKNLSPNDVIFYKRYKNEIF